jgi:DNA-binding Lrp family transcriptional regulator
MGAISLAGNRLRVSIGLTLQPSSGARALAKKHINAYGSHIFCKNWVTVGWRMSTHEMKGKRRAFVFIAIAPGSEEAFIERLMRYEEVLEAHLMVGEYDVLAVLEFEVYGQAFLWSFQEIVSNFVLDKIRRLRGVRDTNTIIPTRSITRREQ